MTLGNKHSFLPDIWLINILMVFFFFSSCLQSHKEIWATAISSWISLLYLYMKAFLMNTNCSEIMAQTAENCNCYWRYAKPRTSHLCWLARRLSNQCMNSRYNFSAIMGLLSTGNLTGLWTGRKRKAESFSWASTGSGVSIKMFSEQNKWGYCLWWSL